MARPQSATWALVFALWAVSAVACSDKTEDVVPVDAVAVDAVADVPCRGGNCSPCSNKSDGMPCDDLDPCTNGDACVSGACIGQSLGCTCKSDADCAKEDDGDLCNGTLTCDLGALPYVCKPKADSKVTCATAGACSEEICQPNTGQCKAVPKAASVACDDGDACTTNQCDGAGACVVTAKICPCALDAGLPLSG